MQTVTVGEFKANFSEMLKKVLKGEEIGISYGKKKEIVARLVPKKEKTQRRKLGALDQIAKVRFAKDYKLSEEEFLDL
ncbi:type II toxin-antitoxin system Phd/YefM family antitoxin [Niabella ginsengisoli]|uniref:Prevent-host-death protein n=1 Tax=Niabella ginsengisoli TaxID=522298 RepID=A0ABS9SE89_9BACT|nr:hypothetical protein [Niabella ginsengisoli]MCH5596666.1 hypothetical protein [Niabella ginsengisoli]